MSRQLGFKGYEQTIQQNPLWMREIELAEAQQKRHLERAKAGAPMRNGEDVSGRVSPAFQWLPRGICQESAFNCFIARETHQSHPSGIRLI